MFKAQEKDENSWDIPSSNQAEEIKSKDNFNTILFCI